ncbi:MAG: glycosyltransferase family 1 protein [Gemmatimonadetes bacterium]|nr:glycosyltransferase family 1 protein [Gemmatimonadota bacterium]
MRILIHSVYYLPEVGGMESHIAGLAEGLVAGGHEVRIVTSRSRAGLDSEEELRGVRIRRSWMPSRSPAGWAAYALGSVPWTRRWARWAEVVHAQSFASVVPAGIAARAAGRPWVASFHTSHFLIRARSPLWRPFLGRLVRWPDHALAASMEIAEVARGLAPGIRVEAITNGVDTDRFSPGPPALPLRNGERRIVVPRRLFKKNGVEFLIRAVPKIRARIPQVRVLVVGDGPERPALEALSREVGAAGAVEFLGARPHGEMPGLLCSGEIAVFPSLMEATSVAALEAMACARPVVATAVGGLPEIVDDGVGILVPPKDPSALADGVVRLLEDRDLRGKGRRARERVVALWSNARLVGRHLEIYEDLVAGRVVMDPGPSVVA